MTIKTKLLIVAQCVVTWRESKREIKNENKGFEIHSSKANLGRLPRDILECGECKKNNFLNIYGKITLMRPTTPKVKTVVRRSLIRL